MNTRFLLPLAAVSLVAAPTIAFAKKAPEAPKHEKTVKVHKVKAPKK